MRLWGALCLSVMGGWSCHGTLPRQEMIQHVLPAVVALYEGPCAATGFFVSPQGHIITSYHTVHKHPHLLARLSDGRRVETRLVGTDAGVDLAVLQVVGTKEPAPPFPCLEWGSTSGIAVGDEMYAFGNPHGVGISVSHGIAAAKDIPLQRKDLNFNSSGQVGFLQTDMMLSLGCSGGPIVDQAGQVVAMTTFILAPGQESIGLGFGTPSEYLKKALDQILLHQPTE